MPAIITGNPRNSVGTLTKEEAFNNVVSWKLMYDSLKQNPNQYDPYNMKILYAPGGGNEFGTIIPHKGHIAASITHYQKERVALLLSGEFGNGIVFTVSKGTHQQWYDKYLALLNKIIELGQWPTQTQFQWMSKQKYSYEKLVTPETEWREAVRKSNVRPMEMNELVELLTIGFNFGNISKENLTMNEFLPRFLRALEEYGSPHYLPTIHQTNG